MFLNMFPVNAPEVMIAQADRRFDPQGKLSDQNTAEFIRKLLVALAVWTRQLRKE